MNDWRIVREVIKGKSRNWIWYTNSIIWKVSRRWSSNGEGNSKKETSNQNENLEEVIPVENANLL